MCSEPVIRAPFSGFEPPNSSRSAIRPGISVSAISISLRQKSARPRSFTTKSLKRVSACVATLRFSKGQRWWCVVRANAFAPSAAQHIKKALYHAQRPSAATPARSSSSRRTAAQRNPAERKQRCNDDVEQQRQDEKVAGNQ